MKYIPLVLILAVGLIIAAGVGVDGGGRIETVQRAHTIAQGAARAGTNAATGTAINGDAFTLSAPAATAAAQAFITAAGARGEARLVAGEVEVTVELDYEPRILSTIGIGTLTVDATASARLIDGA